MEYINVEEAQKLLAEKVRPEKFKEVAAMFGALGLILLMKYDEYKLTRDELFTILDCMRFGLEATFKAEDDGIKETEDAGNVIYLSRWKQHFNR